MTTPSDESAIARLRQWFDRAAFRGVVTGLSAGAALYLLRQSYWSARVFAWTCGLLVALPVVNLLTVLAEEVRRRDWGFALLAAGVTALLGYALVSRL